MTTTPAPRTLRNLPTELEAFARELHTAGFAIYLPANVRDRERVTYFAFTRLDGGLICQGIVQANYFGGFSFAMPVRPTRENGSSITVTGVPDGKGPGDIGAPASALTVENATRVASATNTGPYVSGRFRNVPTVTGPRSIYGPRLTAAEIAAR